MPPAPPLGEQAAKSSDIQADLGKLDPPMKHYKYYNSTAQAAHDWDNPSQGLEAYLRGYFHLKSADWKHNNPHPLKSWSGEGLLEMPGYYIMPQDKSFPEVIKHDMQGEDYSKTESWLSKEDLVVYVSEWSRTGFQGALNWYRAQTASTPQSAKDLFLFAGRRIEGPIGFVSGKQDWGNYQQPGAIEGYDDDKIVKSGCFRGATFIDEAGHWVQQEQPAAVIEAITKFLQTL
jgi:pimeloyl-ACP methyl ester carboxylesterase